MERLLLRVTEAAELVGVGRSKAYELSRGVWPTVKIGTSVRISREWLEAWVREQTAEALADISADGNGFPPTGAATA